jgi:hypothetical protein
LAAEQEEEEAQGQLQYPAVQAAAAEQHMMEFCLALLVLQDKETMVAQVVVQEKDRALVAAEQEVLVEMEVDQLLREMVGQDHLHHYQGRQ